MLRHGSLVVSQEYAFVARGYREHFRIRSARQVRSDGALDINRWFTSNKGAQDIPIEIVVGLKAHRRHRVTA